MYFAGGLNRHATEPIISSFEKREGCTVETAWMGCGLLVSKMKGGETPDVYHTCDTSFHAMVEDRFGQLTNISQTDIIILVPKNNPKNIKSLEDLTKPGMKVGIGDPGKTAMGKLTVDLLKDEGVYEEIKTNIGNFPRSSDGCGASNPRRTGCGSGLRGQCPCPARQGKDDQNRKSPFERHSNLCRQ